MDNHYAKFLLSLKHIKNNIFAKQVGLIAASPDSSIITINKTEPYSILDIFLFNIEGILILSHHFKDSPVTDILLQIIQSSIKRLNHIHSAKQLKNFSFYQIEINTLKLFFLYKSNIIVVGVFRNGMNKHYCKLVLIHLFIAITNFKLNITDKISLLRKANGLNLTNILKHRQHNSIIKSEFNFYDYIELKIFEKYLLKYIITHFSTLFQSITQKSELFLTVIKLKNVLFIDISNEKILFDYAEVNKSKKKINIKTNNALWKQLMYFSNILADNYNKQYGKSYSFNENESKFIKFECTSTYPRYCFFIKYFPILKGVSIVHVYSQNKLSRQSEDCAKKKAYSEFDIIYGFDINKTNMSFEFKYAQPPQLSAIQHFIGEFLLSINKESDLYCDHNDSKQLPYFNTEIIDQINSISFDNISNKTIEDIYAMLNIKLSNLLQKESNGNGITLSCGISPRKRKTPSTKFLPKNATANDINNFITIDKNIILNDLFDKQNGLVGVVDDNNNTNPNNDGGGNNDNDTDGNKKPLTPVLQKRLLNSSSNANNTNGNLYDLSFKNFLAEEVNLQRGNTNYNNNTPNNKNNPNPNRLSIPMNTNNDMHNTTMLSISKWDEIPKEEVSINLSRRISDINGNNSPGINNQNARKRSFFRDEKLIFNEESIIDNDNAIYNNTLEKKNGFAINGLTSNNPNKTHKNISSNKLSIPPERTVKVIRFSSLKLGKAYCKEIATKQLIIQENIDKVLTFQEMK